MRMIEDLFYGNICPCEKSLTRGSEYSHLLIQLFNELVEEYPEYKKYIPELNEDIVRDVLQKINMKVKTQAIIDLVMSRYNLIK